MIIDMPALNLSKSITLDEIMKCAKALDEAATPWKDYYIPVKPEDHIPAWQRWLEENTRRMMENEVKVQEAMIKMELKRLELECNPKMFIDKTGEFKQWIS